MQYLSITLMPASRARCFVISKIAKTVILIKFAGKLRAQGTDERRMVSNLAKFNPQTSGTDSYGSSNLLKYQKRRFKYVSDYLKRRE